MPYLFEGPPGRMQDAAGSPASNVIAVERLASLRRDASTGPGDSAVAAAKVALMGSTGSQRSAPMLAMGPTSVRGAF
jgi:hypothetical protein